MNGKNVRKKARAWMVLNEIRIKDIQLALELKSHVQVSETMSGVRSHRGVLNYLLENGCPAGDLDLPDDLKRSVGN